MSLSHLSFYDFNASRPSAIYSAIWSVCICVLFVVLMRPQECVCQNSEYRLAGLLAIPTWSSGHAKGSSQSKYDRTFVLLYNLKQTQQNNEWRQPLGCWLQSINQLKQTGKSYIDRTRKINTQRAIFHTMAPQGSIGQSVSHVRYDIFKNISEM